MRLFIAEKPSVARAIIAELGATKKEDGYTVCGNDIVTNCFGHMLETAPPERYTPDDVPLNSNGDKLWRVEDLPIIPAAWIYEPKPETKKQLKILGQLIKQADVIVNAGDPDREGQLLVDELLDHFQSTKPVKRYWSNGVDPIAVKKALGDLRDNAGYRGMAFAALARGQADWLVGMNGTRAYTLRAQRGNSRVLISVGRVQTPTLALVVNRDREIENFKPVPYFVLQGSFTHDKGSFTATWAPKDDQPGLDPEHRLTNASIAAAKIADVKAGAGAITVYTQEPKNTPHPLCFSLAKLSSAAMARFGYDPKKTMELAQALYETHKLTTYPRADVGYLKQSLHGEAAQTIAALRAVNPHLASLTDQADPSYKSRVWDDAKVPADAHHGVLPTTHRGNLEALSADERNIYDLIVRSYLAQFFPPHQYLQTTLELAIADEDFRATGRVELKPGWKVAYNDAADQDADDKPEGDDAAGQKIPVMTVGDPVACNDVLRLDKATQPPKSFSAASLQEAMESIHKYVPNAEMRAILKETDGIGTTGTRPNIIEELQRKEYLAPKGKKLVSTTLGRSIIDALPARLKDPAISALFERALGAIEKGSGSIDDFIAKQTAFVTQLVAEANIGSVTIAGGKEVVPISAIHKCQTCGTGLSRRPSTKQKGQFWWSCSNYPTCKQTYQDLAGRPDYSGIREKTAAKTAKVVAGKR